jgi:hypothetical protein
MQSQSTIAQPSMQMRRYGDQETRFCELNSNTITISHKYASGNIARCASVFGSDQWASAPHFCIYFWREQLRDGSGPSTFPAPQVS